MFILELECHSGKLKKHLARGYFYIDPHTKELFLREQIEKAKNKANVFETSV